MDNSKEYFIRLVRANINTIANKAARDFDKATFEKEIASLHSDQVYKSFGLDNSGYALIRLMGRMSISFGRNLGEIYDKVPRQIAAERFKLDYRDIIRKFDGLEIDIALEFNKMETQDVDLIKQTLIELHDMHELKGGLAIEIRYNFNPNDSSRLRKDEVMASKVAASNLTPFYLVFSSISPRDEAIGRLKRAGWKFLVGQEARDFVKRLFGLDFEALFNDSEVKQVIQVQMDALLKHVYNSYAFNKTVSDYKDESK